MALVANPRSDGRCPCLPQFVLADFEFHSESRRKPLPPEDTPRANRFGSVVQDAVARLFVFVEDSAQAVFRFTVLMLFTVVVVLDSQVIFPVLTEAIRGDHLVKGRAGRSEVNVFDFALYLSWHRKDCLVGPHKT